MTTKKQAELDLEVTMYIKVFLLWTLSLVSLAGYSQDLKAMSYNIRIASPPSKGWGVTEIDSIAEVIKRSKAQLVALQEVDVNTERSGSDLDQAKKLGELTGMNFFFAKAVDRSSGDYGVAILSSFPIKNAFAYQIKSPDSTLNENRALAVIELNVQNKELIFASFHLDHLNDEVRSHQLDQIFKYLDKFKHKPLLLGADLNMNSKSRLFPKIKKAGFKILETNMNSLTFPNDVPKTTLDYFMFNNKFSRIFINPKFEVLTDENKASDHLPIIISTTIK